MSVRSLSDDQALLWDVLEEVIRSGEGEAALELHEETVALATAARAGDEGAAQRLAALAAELDVGEAEILVRSLTRWFNLHNLAEDNERIRRLRARELREAPAPRRGSLRDALTRLRDDGMTAQRVQELLDRAEVRLVITAHPTEARRRTTLEKLSRIFAVLRDLDERRDPAIAIPEARRRLLATVQELWGSDELRAVSPTVLDEVRAGLALFVTTIADTIPVVYRDLDAAIAESYPGAGVRSPSLLNFGSWIGGDRDGNPSVTPELTVETLELMREQCLRFLEGRVELLAGRLSFSERVVGPIDVLDALLASGAEDFPDLAEDLAALNPSEPVRRVMTFTRERVRATRHGTPGGYDTPAGLLDDLHTVESALRDGPGSFGALSAAADLRDVIRQVEVFGFHFARLDVREHAKRHRAALDEVLGELGVQDGYAELGEDVRLDLLERQIADHRPLVPMDISGFSESTQQVINTFRMLRAALTGEHRGAVQSYIVSGTEGPADLLEVLLLAKEAGLTRAGGEDAQLRFVPLFEAGATLEAAPQTMDAVLSREVYRTALRACGDEQEVMVGYSDSNKDVGYAASGWGVHQAQLGVAEVVARHGATWVFFHGRGGAVGRGGGPTNVAIGALPPGTVNGRLKTTEQGEVLATKYAAGEIAHRELELACSAVLITALDDPAAAPEGRRAAHTAVMEEIAAHSAQAYRELVHEDPDFVAFFSAVTPVDEISRLRLGSRPAKRSPGGGIDELRAIPWVFSWTQSRIVLPAWFGLGTGLAAAREAHGDAMLAEMAQDWPFFAGLLSNAAMACAKADLAIAQRYIALWDDAEPRDRIWSIVGGELERTREELRTVLGEERLLDGTPVLQASIDRRNPYVDPLSFLQVELLRRLRAGSGDTEALGRLSLLTVNGIAGGLRNTG